MRIRLTQALAELPGTTARDLLNRLVHDDDRVVAQLAGALGRAPGERPGR